MGFIGAGNNPEVSEREIHTYHEVMFYMDDDTLLLTESGQQQIKTNTLLIISKETYHFFRLAENKSFLRMKISLSDSYVMSTPLKILFSGLKIIEYPIEHILSLLNKLCQITKDRTDDARSFHAYSAVLFLLSELNAHESSLPQATRKVGHHTIPHIVNYISDHLEQDLTVATLAREMNYSPSCITHLFKKELGISVHQYITMRRLIHARNLIRIGEKASNLPPACGYRDYSSFYKAYTKFFGYPPSEEKIFVDDKSY
jgi:AraC-like DNA-binding protein